MRKCDVALNGKASLLGIRKLPSSVAKLIDGAQVITSPAAVVKELLENALDAEAQTIELRLESYGLDRIEVRDNGSGISSDDAPYAALCHYTSKLHSEDPFTSSMYGFRGVALASVCQTGKLSILTMTEGQKSGTLYTYKNSGDVESQSVKAATRGTTVAVTELFKNLPVRRQYYNNINKKNNVMKEVENIVKAYAIIRNDIRLVLYHNRKLILQKVPSPDIKSAFEHIFGRPVASQMEEIHYNSTNENSISISCVFPKKNSEVCVTSRTQSNVIFVFINKRPVQIKSVNQLLKQYYYAGHSLSGVHGRSPCCVVAISLPTKNVDVNVQPDKRVVYIEDKEKVLEALELLLQKLYDIKLETSVSKHEISSSNESTDSVLEELQSSFESQSALLTTVPILIKPFVETDADVEKPTNDTNLNGSQDSALTSTPSDPEILFDFAASSPKPDKNNIEADRIIETITIDDLRDDKSLKQDLWRRGQICGQNGNIIQGAQLLVGKRPSESEIGGYKKAKTDVDTIFPKVSQISSPTILKQNRQNSLGAKWTNNVKKFKVTEINQRSILEFREKPTVVETKRKFSMKTLKDFESRTSFHEIATEYNANRLIGKLENNFWITCKDQILGILIHHRMQELVLYHKLMSTHRLSTRPLEIPEVLTEIKLGRAALDTITELSSKKQSEFVSVVDDDRIYKNGFSITITEGHNGLIVNLMGIADHIPSYSLDDFQECLCYLQSDPNVSLYNCRPARVEAYLKREALRMNSVHNVTMSYEDVTDLLDNSEMWIPKDKQYNCLHDRPLFFPLKDMRRIL